MSDFAGFSVDPDVVLRRGQIEADSEAFGETPARPPAVDPEAFKAAMRVLAAGVVMVTARQGGELFGQVVGLVGAPPALALVDATAQGVEQRVDVRTHPQPEERDVVAGVADDGQLQRIGIRRQGVGLSGVVEKASEEPGAADSSGESGDAHAPILSAGRPPLLARGGPRDFCPRISPTGLTQGV